MNQTTSIDLRQFPTDHERAEWLRMSQSASVAGRHDVAAEMAEAAQCEYLMPADFGRIMNQFCVWLALNEYPAA